MAALIISGTYPFSSENATNDLVSLGKQLPPKPQPATKYASMPGFTRVLFILGFNLLSKLTPVKPSFTSMFFIASDIFAISLEYEIKRARKEFAAYLIISAVRRFVLKMGTPSNTL